ncbi:MAG: DNA-binding response regulator [Bellilinea sp.]|nr:MAG: DNA-binding response regulator [Bellilinea sp.]
MNQKSSEKKRILLADDHTILRSGLRLMLSTQPDWEVVGEAANGAETIEKCEQLQPNLIILDVSMPGLGGLDILPALRRAAPGVKILILTMHDDKHYLQEALRNGASGYVLKKAADTELITAIQAVLKGEFYVHHSMMRFVLEDVLDNQATPSDEWDQLSEREQQVLQLVALGYTSAEIAEKLALSPKTVETYRARGMEKLGLRSRAALVRYALRRGLISPS